MNEDQVFFSAQETEAKVIPLPCERLCKWWAEAKWGSVEKVWR